MERVRGPEDGFTGQLDLHLQEGGTGVRQSRRGRLSRTCKFHL